ncbi:vitamin K epoxide reductase family protein [Riemerella anatipestifer]|nr:vitamin K epoxide reductase family protein [Riemerella anatipestifer]MDY3358740.1 vitamin K epoxide reductase family protein [Riemerella anatipestifer]
MNFNYLLINVLNLDKTEFLFQFQSHPNYPSALAFSDTLNFMGVKNEAYELEKEYWEELPKEFITLYNKQFVLVHRNDDKAIIYADNKNIVPFSELVEKSENIVFLIENHIESEKETSKNIGFQKLVFGVLGAILLVNSLIQWNIWAFIYQVLSLVALYFFLEIFKDKFGNQSPVLQSFCDRSIGESQQKTTCEDIFKSKELQLFGLTFSDFGLIYFLGLAVLPLLIKNTSTILILVSGLALLSIVYSLYYQISKKNFCKVCFLIIGILVVQFLIAYFQFSSTYTVSECIITLFIFVVFLFGLYHLNHLISEKEEYKRQNIKNLRFKRSYGIFKRELILEDKVNFEDKKNGFFFGNENARIHISMISNPFCGFCKDTHIFLEDLIKKYPEQVSVQIRFNFFDAEKEYRDLISVFDELYRLSPQKMLNAIRLWYETKELEILKKKLGIESQDNQNLNIYYQIGNENLQNHLNFTPIILINGYKYPQSYDREDILYFIEELLEDEDLIYAI